MKKEVGPIAIIASAVLALGIVAFVLYQAMTATVPTVHVTTPPDDHPQPAMANSKPAMVNGKPVPPGAPYQEYLKHQQNTTSP